MLSFPAAINVYLCTVPCDMRRFFDGLSMMAADASEEIAEVGIGIELEALAGGDQTGQDGSGLLPKSGAL
jgi:hypothetical protein